MPWSGESFRQSHNRNLTIDVARQAATQANALIARGVPEGEAIAIANKHAAKLMKGAKPASKGKK